MNKVFNYMFEVGYMNRPVSITVYTPLLSTVQTFIELQCVNKHFFYLEFTMNWCLILFIIFSSVCANS